MGAPRLRPAGHHRHHSPPAWAPHNHYFTSLDEAKLHPIDFTLTQLPDSLVKDRAMQAWSPGLCVGLWLHRLVRPALGPLLVTAFWLGRQFTLTLIALLAAVALLTSNLYTLVRSVVCLMCRTVHELPRESHLVAGVFEMPPAHFPNGGDCGRGSGGDCNGGSGYPSPESLSSVDSEIGGRCDDQPPGTRAESNHRYCHSHHPSSQRHPAPDGRSGGGGDPSPYGTATAPVLRRKSHSRSYDDLNALRYALHSHNSSIKSLGGTGTSTPQRGAGGGESVGEGRSAVVSGASPNEALVRTVSLQGPPPRHTAHSSLNMPLDSSGVERGGATAAVVDPRAKGSAGGSSLNPLRQLVLARRARRRNRLNNSASAVDPPTPDVDKSAPTGPVKGGTPESLGDLLQHGAYEGVELVEKIPHILHKPTKLYQRAVRPLKEGTYDNGKGNSSSANQSGIAVAPVRGLESQGTSGSDPHSTTTAATTAASSHGHVSYQLESTEGSNTTIDPRQPASLPLIEYEINTNGNARTRRYTIAPSQTWSQPRSRNHTSTPSTPIHHSRQSSVERRLHNNGSPVPHNGSFPHHLYVDQEGPPVVLREEGGYIGPTGSAHLLDHYELSNYNTNGSSYEGNSTARSSGRKTHRRRFREKLSSIFHPKRSQSMAAQPPPPPTGVNGSDSSHGLEGPESGYNPGVRYSPDHHHHNGEYHGDHDPSYVAMTSAVMQPNRMDSALAPPQSLDSYRVSEDHGRRSLSQSNSQDSLNSDYSLTASSSSCNSDQPASPHHLHSRHDSGHHHHHHHRRSHSSGDGDTKLYHHRRHHRQGSTKPRHHHRRHRRRHSSGSAGGSITDGGRDALHSDEAAARLSCDAERDEGSHRLAPYSMAGAGGVMPISNPNY
ncbi:hypothetical protein BJ085DRAFT_38296 [Dimargaris cristalligena]|uniref:Uncharacterized protein n=1 Tax=Dimargaris cristalligena TaxID=215637 RepID=A0A4Q0A3I1_9FUNG|nr:hypothetical protein BJ085DRAFT_38296 [Dimargaris cristalligena]|eukprot:RKP39820.1 hypothetical protein BJ085DRAFT_38296 [Dimargaris cristalligena]